MNNSERAPQEAQQPQFTLHNDSAQLPRCIGEREIFEQLLEAELRAGRLTQSSRRHVIAYAAQLGLSAVEVGRMIDQMRDEALESDDPALQRHALKLIPAPPPRVPIVWQLSCLVFAAIVADLIYLLLRK